MDLPLYLLTFIRFIILKTMGLIQVDRPNSAQPESTPCSVLQEFLPVKRFGEVGSGQDPTEKCVVCQYEFEDYEEIRRLTMCGHIFHRRCLEKWVEHDQKTCPVCRIRFIPDHVSDLFCGSNSNSELPEFGGEFALINSFL